MQNASVSDELNIICHVVQQSEMALATRSRGAVVLEQLFARLHITNHTREQSVLVKSKSQLFEDTLSDSSCCCWFVHHPSGVGERPLTTLPKTEAEA